MLVTSIVSPDPPIRNSNSHHHKGHGFLSLKIQKAELEVVQAAQNIARALWRWVYPSFPHHYYYTLYDPVSQSHQH